MNGSSFMNTVIFVTDKRQSYLGEFLPGRRMERKWEDEDSQESCLQYLREAELVILPTPAGKLINRQDIVEILKHNVANAYVAGGKIPLEWKENFVRNACLVYDLMDDEVVATQNAWITAEATVCEYIARSAYSLRGQKILITGYGKCAKALAKLLQSMGAKVTILARSVEARKQAKADGHNAVEFSYGPEEVYGAGGLINTVPACVIGRSILAELDPTCVFLDIASAPGGVDLQVANAYGISPVQLPGLPGRYTTKSSAKVFSDAIFNQFAPQIRGREEKTWIFQIVM